MQPVATDAVLIVNPAKMAQPIKMPFGM